MNGHKVSIMDALRFAFESIVDHIKLFVCIFFVGSALSVLGVGVIALLNKGLILSLLDSTMFQSFQQCIGSNCLTIVYQSGRPLVRFMFENSIPLIISGTILALFFSGLDLGFRQISLDLYDRNQGFVETLWSHFNAALSACVGWILYCAMMWCGFMLFVIPGFIVLLRFGFFPFFIIDKNQNAVQALKSSYHLTRNNFWDILAFWLILKAIVYVGFLTYIGAILTWPITTLAYAHVYRQLMLARPAQ